MLSVEDERLGVGDDGEAPTWGDDCHGEVPGG